MATTRTVLKFRRRREGRTNYRKRLARLKSGMCRLVIRPSNKHISLQMVRYTPHGDVVVIACSSARLGRFGWKAPTANLSAAYLTGLLCGTLAKGKITEAILDTRKSQLTKGNIIYAALHGVVAAGIKVPHSQEKFPREERIAGQHIKAYAELLKKKDPERYKYAFSGYLKRAIAPEQIVAHFEEVKKKIRAA